MVRAGIWRVGLAPEQGNSTALPNLFLHYLETVSCQYLFPSLRGSASDVPLTPSHGTITLSTLSRLNVEVLLPQAIFFSLWPMAYKQYYKSWGSNLVVAWLVWADYLQVLIPVRCWEVSKHMPGSADFRGTLETLGVWVFNCHTVEYLWNFPRSELLSKLC